MPNETSSKAISLGLRASPYGRLVYDRATGDVVLSSWPRADDGSLELTADQTVEVLNVVIEDLVTLRSELLWRRYDGPAAGPAADPMKAAAEFAAAFKREMGREDWEEGP
jgi:hypothetical protein